MNIRSSQSPARQNHSIAYLAASVTERKKFFDGDTRRGFKSHIGYWTGHIDYYDHTAEERYYPVVRGF